MTGIRLVSNECEKSVTLYGSSRPTRSDAKQRGRAFGVISRNLLRASFIFGIETINLWAIDIEHHEQITVRLLRFFLIHGDDLHFVVTTGKQRQALDHLTGSAL